MKNLSKDNQIYPAILILFMVGLVSFLGVLDNDFINWDDPAQVFANPLVKELSFGNLFKIFHSSVSSEYHPLVTTIFSFEYHLFGPNPGPYHLRSLFLHLANTLLVFFLFYRLSGKVPVALAGALLFEVHPLQVQPAAWISARKDLLFTFFYLSSFLSYYSYWSHKKKNFYLLSLLFFICSLLSKSLAVTLPVILLLWLYSEKKRVTIKEFKGMLPFFFLALAAGWFALRMQVVRETGSAARLAFGFENVILLFSNLQFYLFHILFPLNLSPIYIFPKSINFWEPLSWSSFLLIFSLSIGLWMNRGNKPLVRGAVFFVITLFPVLRFIPFAGVEVVAHRFVYLPCVGLFYIGGWIFYRLMGQRPGRIRKCCIIILLTIIILSLSTLSANRCRIWKDSPTVWAEAIKKQGDSELFYYMLADYHLRLGHLQKTIDLCDKAISINPAVAHSYLIKARAQIVLGKTKEVKVTIKEYLSVLYRLGRWKQAEKEKESLKIYLDLQPE